MAPHPLRIVAPGPRGPGGARPPRRPGAERDARRRLEVLRERVREGAENRPGVYVMYGEDGEPVYVGKSIRVRTRLLSYFRASPDEKAREILRATSRIEWEHVPDEFGALLREMRLIQDGRPRFNVVHKRKRAYAFVKLTWEPAPRLVPVRTVRADGSTYYGPFPAVGRTARTVRELSHLLGLRDCAASTPVHWSDQLDIFGGSRPPRCLRAGTGTCLAPCTGRPEEREYRRKVEAARAFLEDRGNLPLLLVRDRMRAASERRDYEYAAILRDRMRRLAAFRQELVAFRGEVEGLSFVYRAEAREGRPRLYLVRRGRVRATVPEPRSSVERRALAARVREVWEEPDPGPAGLSARDAAEILLVARWFRLHPEERERTRSPWSWWGDGGDGGDGRSGSPTGGTGRSPVS